MGCTAPLVRFNDGKIQSLKALKYNHYSEQSILGILKAGQAQLIPCGKCIQCRLTQSRHWADRMEMELPYHKDNWFLTLTYDNEHVPVGMNVNPETGEITTTNLTLDPKDLQDFWKRLRRNIQYHKRGEVENLMYYACGEYGDKTNRPHYHAIVYDLPIKADELIELKRKNGYVYYTCEWLQKVWGMGNIYLAAVEWECCAYVARYVVKKRKGKDAKMVYSCLAIEPEFVRMSLKPAIGARYYEDHKDEIYPKDYIQLSKGKTCTPPRYFDLKRDKENLRKELENWDVDEDLESMPVKVESDEMREIKRKRRKKANDALFAQLKQTGLTWEELNQLKDEQAINRNKKLLRPDN